MERNGEKLKQKVIQEKKRLFFFILSLSSLVSFLFFSLSLSISLSLSLCFFSLFPLFISLFYFHFFSFFIIIIILILLFSFLIRYISWWLHLFYIIALHNLVIIFEIWTLIYRLNSCMFFLCIYNFLPCFCILLNIIIDPLTLGIIFLKFWWWFIKTETL